MYNFSLISICTISIALVIIQPLNSVAGYYGTVKLEKIIEKSKYIVIGTVEVAKVYYQEEKNDDPSVAPCPFIQESTIRIEKIIKSEENIDKITLHACTTISLDHAIFAKGEKCVVFINEHNNRHYVVRGYQGKILIENDSLCPRYIQEYMHIVEFDSENCESKCHNISLKKFLEDIDKVIKTN